MKAVKPTLPFDPFALAKAGSDVAMSLAMRPQDLMQVQMDAARQWGDFWIGALTGKPSAAPRDRRFKASEWQDDRLLPFGSRRLSAGLETAARAGRDRRRQRPVARPRCGLLLDQYLNAISPANFAFTNPEVVKRTKESGGTNLVQGFANLLEDIASGKGIVKRRTDDNVFVKGKTIAATPGAVVFQNDLFQLIQYNPATAKVAAEPLLYVPPLVNRYYMIDLTPDQSLVKWLVDEGRTVFVISWVNPGPELKDKGVDDYVLDGIVAAIGEVA